MAETLRVVASRAGNLQKEAFLQLLRAANPKSWPTLAMYDSSPQSIVSAGLSTQSHRNALALCRGVDDDTSGVVSDRELYNYYILGNLQYDESVDVCSASTMKAREENRPVRETARRAELHGNVQWTDCSSINKMLAAKNVKGVYCQPCLSVRGWKAGDPCPADLQGSTPLVINVGKGFGSASIEESKRIAIDSLNKALSSIVPGITRPWHQGDYTFARIGGLTGHQDVQAINNYDPCSTCLFVDESDAGSVSEKDQAGQVDLPSTWEPYTGKNKASYRCFTEESRHRLACAIADDDGSTPPTGTADADMQRSARVKYFGSFDGASGVDTFVPAVGDVDKNGKLSFGETVGMDKSTFKTIDVDGDGQLTSVEYTNWQLKHNKVDHGDDTEALNKCKAKYPEIDSGTAKTVDGCYALGGDGNRGLCHAAMHEASSGDHVFGEAGTPGRSCYIEEPAALDQWPSWTVNFSGDTADLRLENLWRETLAIQSLNTLLCADTARVDGSIEKNICAIAANDNNCDCTKIDETQCSTRKLWSEENRKPPRCTLNCCLKSDCTDVLGLKCAVKEAEWWKNRGCIVAQPDGNPVDPLFGTVASVADLGTIEPAPGYISCHVVCTASASVHVFRVASVPEPKCIPRTALAWESAGCNIGGLPACGMGCADVSIFDMFGSSVDPAHCDSAGCHHDHDAPAAGFTSCKISCSANGEEFTVVAVLEDIEKCKSRSEAEFYSMGCIVPSGVYVTTAGLGTPIKPAPGWVSCEITCKKIQPTADAIDFIVNAVREPVCNPKSKSEWATLGCFIDKSNDIVGSITTVGELHEMDANERRFVGQLGATKAAPGWLSCEIKCHHSDDDDANAGDFAVAAVREPTCIPKSASEWETRGCVVDSADGRTRVSELGTIKAANGWFSCTVKCTGEGNAFTVFAEEDVCNTRSYANGRAGRELNTPIETSPIQLLGDRYARRCSEDDCGAGCKTDYCAST